MRLITTSTPHYVSATPVRPMTVNGVLARMSITLDPSHSVYRSSLKPFAPHVCHYAVAAAVSKRGNVEDKIWLFGHKSSGIVTHSVLTDNSNRVLVDSLKATGRFSPKHYSFTDDTSDVLDLLAVVYVSDLYDNDMFFSYVYSS